MQRPTALQSEAAMKQIDATVTERGQVTIPAEVRRLLGLTRGSRVTFRINEGVVTIEAAPFTWRSAFGSVKPLDPPMDYDKQWEAAKEELVERSIRKMRE
jgi:AbrB family looped-hinge helix DNA binding protein